MIYVTISTPKLLDARKVANILLKERLARQIHLLENITSMKFVNGEVDETQEQILLIPTRARLYTSIERRLMGDPELNQVLRIKAMPVVNMEVGYMEYLIEGIVKN